MSEFSPTDVDPGCLASIAAWRAEAALPNLRPPVHLDVCAPAWFAAGDQVFDAVVQHQHGPYRAVGGLPRACWLVWQAVLQDEGPLLLYGPFRITGPPYRPSTPRSTQA